MNAPTSENGYVDAFYELKEMMDIGARAQSPAEVWRTQMRPRLAALLAKPSVVGGIDRVGLVNERLDNGQGSIVLDPDQSAAGASSGMVKTDLPIGDADHLAATGAVDVNRDDVEIGASHGAGVSDAAESHQAIPARENAAGPARITSLADALPAEINRVRAVQDTYKELRNMPNVIVEPQIMMMENAIQDGIAASAAGDVVAMLRAYEELKGWEE